nr:hypothetical protein [Alkalilimnicola ehrlichii]
MRSRKLALSSQRAGEWPCHEVPIAAEQQDQQKAGDQSGIDQGKHRKYHVMIFRRPDAGDNQKQLTQAAFIMVQA